MRIDRIKVEGRCECGEEIELDLKPNRIAPSIAEVKARCSNPDCTHRFFTHVQETKI